MRERVLTLAHDDERVVAAAVVGSLARGEGDRWSDLDLSFGLADGVSRTEVLDEWESALRAEFGAVALFDLPSGAFVYRVLLIPGGLQVDLSVAPASRFGPRGPEFQLLFGDAVHAEEEGVLRSADEMFGYAAHHAVRARVAIERGRMLQAEQWLGGLRAEVVALACRRHGLQDWQARGAHLLPDDAQARLSATLARSLESAELRRALGAAIDALCVEGAEAGIAGAVSDELRRLGAARDPGE
ncbi:hypothetical protein GCM10025866_33420 [Naasia aerilata]|uniref:Nucleotidyltransferase domain-containing protein n=1 Tax=Naasia aerilata TaxID=1162966 RepID=A0ABM8GGF1_9MICO|nr:hypothetical protein GCM10025866_33420 [Naasia aerilata]